MARRIVTGEDVQSLPEGAILDLPADAILTAVAREWIDKKHIKIVRKPRLGDATSRKLPKARVALGSDHAGFEMKEALKSHLREAGVTFIDYGAFTPQSVDYPDVAHAVAVAVAVGDAELGIVLDGAGIGSAIAANKVPGVRAAVCHDEATASNSREHNDANVLTLGARLLGKETIERIVGVFLSTSMTEERHRARVRKILDIENRYYRPV